MVDRKIIIWSTIVILFAVILLTALFLIGEAEYFKLWKLVDHSKIASYFTSIQGILIIATVIIAAAQFLHNIQARSNDIRPEIVAIQKTFKWQRHDDNMLRIARGKNPEALIIEHGIFEPTEIINTSVNPAKNLNFEWIYDIESVTEQILKNYGRGSETKILHDIILGPFDHEYLEGGKSLFIRNSNYYLLMWSHPLAVLTTNFDDKQDYPELHLSLKYENIDGLEIKKLYKAKVYLPSDTELIMNFSPVIAIK